MRIGANGIEQRKGRIATLDVNYKSACLGIKMCLWVKLCNEFKGGQIAEFGLPWQSVISKTIEKSLHKHPTTFMFPKIIGVELT